MDHIRDALRMFRRPYQAQPVRDDRELVVSAPNLVLYDAELASRLLSVQHLRLLFDKHAKQSQIDAESSELVASELANELGVGPVAGLPGYRSFRAHIRGFVLFCDAIWALFQFVPPVKTPAAKTPPVVASADPSLPPPPPPVAARVVVVARRDAGPTVPMDTLWVAGVPLHKIAILLIFRQLHWVDLVAASRVCRAFCLVAREDSLWDAFSGVSVVKQSMCALRVLNDNFQWSVTGNSKKRFAGQMAEVFTLPLPPCFRCDNRAAKTFMTRAMLRQGCLWAVGDRHSSFFFCAACVATKAEMRCAICSVQLYPTEALVRRIAKRNQAECGEHRSL